ncbi:MAG: flippase-like domain-containing protein [Myxococcales bacterium]|nr:flippase-like domain-containing protein [Myxococcales bacterium]
MTSGASRRERIIGITALLVSRLSAILLSLMILRAVGTSISFGFVAAWTVGSFPIYLASTLVPMGLGVSEGGYYGLFRTLGYNPAFAVTLVIARRCITLMYATIGLLLVTFSETVKRAKARHRERDPVGVSVPALPIVVAEELD